MVKIDKNENFRNVKTPIETLHQSYEGYYRNFFSIKKSNFSYRLVVFCGRCLSELFQEGLH